MLPVPRMPRVERLAGGVERTALHTEVDVGLRLMARVADRLAVVCGIAAALEQRDDVVDLRGLGGTASSSAWATERLMRKDPGTDTLQCSTSNAVLWHRKKKAGARPALDSLRVVPAS